MMGFLFSAKECCEMEYLIRRELEELLLDLGDYRIEAMVKKAMEERYKSLFKMYSRFVSPKELAKYIRNKRPY
ncbi:hypothetical protein PP175_01825 [Aneurinibacillus sp. Ricciae_BoGa-3]|uniref:hypothetical protein n=1 Tax=Aneurinibacillus sp. Ricciae_BoGa-3 TaxID=3022697 RepID=UPI0023417A60|nr:hypothetical protein [Aneurinibacillus sp. Ricciae_BoGa-3]WCK56700.1 hypothetical protein PP175_01825 [Aneurinibacillus sp. Ricciae_BoGa-3]